MGKPGPETKLVAKMRKAGEAKYGKRLRVVKYHGSQFGEAGVSDLLCCLDGVFIACEVKSPEAPTHKRATLQASIEHALTKGPTVKQRLYVADVLEAGGVAGFAATVEQYMVMLACADSIHSASGIYVCTGHNLNGSDFKEES